MCYHVIRLASSIQAMAWLVCLLLQSLKIALSISNWSLVPYFSSYTSSAPGRIPSKCLYITSAMSFHMRGRQEMGLKLSTAFPLPWSFKHRIVLPKVCHSGSSSSYLLCFCVVCFRPISSATYILAALMRLFVSVIVLVGVLSITLFIYLLLLLL